MTSAAALPTRAHTGRSEVLTSESTLRFRDEEELRESLGTTGYAVCAVRQAPDRPDREYAFIAQAGG